MRLLIKITLVLIVFMMSAVLWVIGGHEYRTLKRLERSHAVLETRNCQLLYSTGYLKENTHIFECPPQDILSAEKGGLDYTQIIPGKDTEWDFARVKPLLDSHIKPEIDWKQATVRSADGKGILSSVYVVNCKNKCYITLETF